MQIVMSRRLRVDPSYPGGIRAGLGVSSGVKPRARGYVLDAVYRRDTDAERVDRVRALGREEKWEQSAVALSGYPKWPAAEVMKIMPPRPRLRISPPRRWARVTGPVQFNATN